MWVDAKYGRKETLHQEAGGPAREGQGLRQVLQRVRRCVAKPGGSHRVPCVSFPLTTGPQWFIKWCMLFSSPAISVSNSSSLSWPLSSLYAR